MERKIGNKTTGICNVKDVGCEIWISSTLFLSFSGREKANGSKQVGRNTVIK